MGQLVNGKWLEEASYAEKKTGEFKRQSSQFLGQLEAEKLYSGQYVLVVSSACPWCHRVLILRSLYGLVATLPIVEVDPYMLNNGWAFTEKNELGKQFVYELYQATQSDYSGRVTVPVIWDKVSQQIICNESDLIVNELISVSNYDGSTPFKPSGYEDKINEWITKIYQSVNNGVYKTGFATTQEAYERSFTELFSMLDEIDEHLKVNPYLCGERLTKADWYLFVTLIRFDAVYYSHFKCSARRLTEYETLFAYTRELYQMKEVATTVNFDIIKRHYFGSHRFINPTGIIPKGPAINWLAPHGRFAEYY